MLPVLSLHPIIQGAQPTLQEEHILSEELKEDKKLVLSNKLNRESELDCNSVQGIIANSIRSIKINSPSDKFNALKEPISYPNNYVFASLIEGIYTDDKKLYVGEGGKYLHGKKVYPELGNWQLLTVGYDPDSVAYDSNIKKRAKSFAAGLLSGAHRPNGYSGAAYWNPDTQQVIIVHSGTKNTGGWDADLRGVFLNDHVAQIDSAITFTDKVISVIKEINEDNKRKGMQIPYIQLFITGHSLGAWLAPITAFSAKYLEKVGDHFVANSKFETTGYHASTVIFDGPGCEEMLRRIQRSLMNRYGHSFINSLDITNYLSAPNLINACNPQVGEIYRLFINLSQEDREHLERLKNKNIVGELIESIKNWSIEKHIVVHTAITHKIVNIKGVFNPKTGEALKDNGNLRIEKVEDWPLLTSGNQKEEVRSKTLHGVKWGVKTVEILGKLAAKVIEATVSSIPIGAVINGIEATYGIYKSAFWYNELLQELECFLELADESNNYRLVKGLICSGTDGRKIRYKTKYLNDNNKNERSLNAFTQPERKFLEEYKFLERYQEDLQGIVTLKKLFDSFKNDKKLMNDTMEMLKGCTVENGIVRSKNLQEFIPYIKRMLHFFPEMKQKVAESYYKLPSDIHNKLYQLISFSYLNSIKNSLDFGEDNFGFKVFLEDNNLKILHTVQSCTSLGAIKVYKIFNLVSNDYRSEEHHAFLNLDKIFYLGGEIFISFLNKIDHKYLLVAECDEELNDKDDMLNSKIKGFFVNLFETLQESHNANAKHLKVILATERGSDLSKFISRHVVNNQSMCQETIIEVRFNDLTTDSQKKLLKETVVFQGREVPLSRVVNGSNDLDTIIDPETIAELFKNHKIEIGKPLPSLGETENYYIDRKLVKKVKVKEEVLKDDNLTDLFAISNINKEELSRIVGKGKVRNFSEEDNDRSSPIRFITLNAEEDFKNLCSGYSNHTIHWLKKEYNGDIIWKRSHGRTFRRYIENYESDLPENEYSEKNSSIKMIDVNHISKFDERFIVVAAEPGMGKTTALTRLGTQKADDSKWIIRINLVEYKDKLEQRDFSKEGSVVTFLHENNIVSNTLAKKLLESRLNNSGNIVFLLDGFDEITSIGQKNVVNLIKKLQETKVEKVVISTRLHLRNELENILSTIAYTFKPFFREDQKQFLEKFWQRPNIDTEGRLDNYINKLLEFISKSIGDKERKFMGIPMQMRMVAEAFQEVTKDQELLGHPERTFPQNFDMLKLYDHFVNTKYRVYSGKIGVNVAFNKVQKVLFTKELNKIHMRLGIRVIFPEKEEDFVGDKHPSKEEEQEMNLVGIVQFIDDRVVFTHRTFGEYFSAGFLAEKLIGCKNNKKYKTIIEFLAKEIFERKNETIKTFLDYRLAKEQIHAAVLRGKFNDIISEENINVTDALGRSALHYAAQEGYKEIVDIYLKNGVGIRKTDKLGKTPLHYAARYNHGIQVVSCLLENAEDCINSKDKNGHTAVYYAAQQGNWNIVDRILKEKGASVEGLDKEKLLFHYTYKGSLESIQNVVGEEEMDITAIRDSHGNTLLHIAIQKVHFTIVEFLLGKGADVGVANNSGKKPISYAAEQKHWSIVESLLKKKAEFNDLSDTQKPSLLKYSTEIANWDIVKFFMEDNGRNKYFGDLGSQQRVDLLFYLIYSRDWDIAEFLIEKGTGVNNSDKLGKKPIHYATENQCWNIAELLLKKGARLTYLSKIQQILLLDYFTRNFNWDVVKVFMKDSNKDSYFDELDQQQKMHFLYHFISTGDLDITKFVIQKLIEKEKNDIINTPNNCGKTFLHIAAQNGKLNIVQYLVDEKGADIGAITDRGSTPLHLSAKNGHSEVVKYLTGKGANIHAKDSNGKVPLDFATDNNYFETIVCIKEEVAKIFYKRCEYNEALKSYREVFDIQKRPDVLGPDHPKTLNTQHNIAVVLFNQGKYNEAYQVYKEVFDSRKRLDILGLDYLDILSAENNMAEVLDKQGKYSEALEAFRHVFKEREEILDPDHPDTLKARHNMALVLHNQGKYSEALKTYQEVFDIQSRPSVLGIDHPDTLRSRNNISGGLQSKGKYDYALKAHKEMLDKRKLILGPEHPDTLTTRNNIAGVLHSQGKCDDALKAYKEILDKRKFILGSEHKDTLTTRNNIAGVLHSQGKYDDALKVYKDILDKRKVILGPEHPDTLTTRNSIARVLHSQGKYDDAFKAYEEILDKRNVILGPEHPDTLTTRNNIAGVLHSQGKCDDALKAYKEILDKRKFICGPEHKDTLTTRNNIAGVLHSQGKYDDALMVYKDILDKRKVILGPEHPDTLTTRNSIAGVLHSQGKYDDAFKAYKEILDKRKVILGPEHPDNLTTRNNIAGVLHSQGKYDDALKVYKEILDKRNVILGPEHPDTLTTRNNIAGVFQSQGKYDDAFKVYKEILDKRKVILGPEHPDTLSTRNNITEVLSNQGKYSKALETFQEVFDIQKRRDVLGPNHPDTLRTHHNTATVLSLQDKYSKALEIYQEVFEKKRDVLGPFHPDTLSTYHNMAVMYSELDNYNQALKILQEVFEKRRDISSPNHPDTLMNSHNIAIVLSNMGNHSKALEMYEEVFQKRRDVLGPDHPDTLRTRHNMAAVLSNQGNHSKALEIYREVFEKKREVLGPDHPDTLITRQNMKIVSRELEKGCSI